MAVTKKQKRRPEKPTPSALLRRLDRCKAEFGTAAAAAKLDFLRRLQRCRLSSARDVLALHDALCFLRAFPDNHELLSLAERMLNGFPRRTDLRKFRDELEDSGIAGTVTQFEFFWFTARWLERRWPGCLTVDWDSFEAGDQLEALLNLLMPYSESPALDEWDLPLREWVRRLKGPGETDAGFLVRRFEALDAGTFLREKSYDELEIPLRIKPGPATPSRTTAKYAKSPVIFQTNALDTRRPDLRKEIGRTPVRVHNLSLREGQSLIDLARAAMVPRRRDLDIFEYADNNDVRLVDCDGGLQFACIGAIPEWRLMLEAVYGFLTLKNGVPTGYVLSSALFNSSEVAYNVFETFRGAESARVYLSVLAALRHLFGSDAFTIDPYQLGHDNEEGLQSGAWWFYYKLGFRPRDATVRSVLRKELDRMKRNRRHRSSVATLQELSSENLFFHLGANRADVMGRLSPGNVGMKIVRMMAGRFGSDREAGLHECSKEAAKLLGVRSFKGFTKGERLWWERWSPLVLALPGVRRWSAADKRALVMVIRAKGGRRESDFVRRFDAHTKLRAAVLKLAR